MSENKSDKTSSPTPGFFVELGRSFADGAWETLRWVLVGAVVGAIALGGAGGYYFGWSGFGYGLVVGAVIGGLASLWLASEV